jgi:hypothetical protein
MSERAGLLVVLALKPGLLKWTVASWPITVESE